MNKKKFTNKTVTILLGLIPFVLIIFAWQILVSYKLVPVWLIPGPIATIVSFFKLILDGTLFTVVLISLGNVLPAFIFGLGVASIFGIAIGTNKTFREIFYPFLVSIYPIPSIAWLPLAILLLGYSRQTIWLVIFIASFNSSLYPIISGVRHIDKNWLLAAKNTGLSKTKTIFHIVVPGSLPAFITGARMAFSTSWRILIVAEMLGVSMGGLGKFIWMAQWAFDFDKVFSGIIVLSIISIVIEKLVFKSIEQKTLEKWGIAN